MGAASGALWSEWALLLVFGPALRFPEINTGRLVFAKSRRPAYLVVQTLDNAAMTANVW